MMNKTWTRQEARNILSESHGFSRLEDGRQGVLRCFQRHPCVQVDSIDVAGRNQDFTLYSRLRNYRREHLQDLLYEERALFEYYCKMLSILPVETYPIFGFRMKEQQQKYRPFFEKHKAEIDYILDAVKEGPICSRDLKHMGTTQWSWGQRARVGNTLLTRLWAAGELMVHHRSGNTKYYGLTEDIIPEEYLEEQRPEKEDALKEVASLIVRSSRIVSPSKAPEQWYGVGKVKEVRQTLAALVREGRVFTVNVEGWRGKLYCPAEDEQLWEEGAGQEESFVRFLAPLDPLLWNRALFQHIYGHEYVWEVYKKKEDRIYGYYCLPILFGGEYVGLIEPRFRSEDGVLEIRSLHLFNSLDGQRTFNEMFNEELVRFVNYLGAEHIENHTGHEWLDELLDSLPS
ncbi:winged helix-turn-helix domain-containing protein [Candidatus Thorarchaeota archaeon]|nr:MAG: winged helix-turn-helix domain-containing protein [Candidatus Thorarchaeota archaeon]